MSSVTEIHICEREIIHEYEDGVKVQLVLDEYGMRTFFHGGEPICKFPGYKITKFVITDKSALGEITKGDGKFILSNDGPLLLVFKILGKVRINLMKVLNHTYDDQFNSEFESQYGHEFMDLFPESQKTSSFCHVFRQGSRSTLMEVETDTYGRSLIYMGFVVCEPKVETESKVEINTEPKVVLKVNDQNDLDKNLLCYRTQDGEMQFLRPDYLRAVAIMTGRSMEYLITGKDEGTGTIPAEEFSPVPPALKDKTWIQLHDSRFPRMIDLFSLFILAGINPSRKILTVLGFSPKHDDEGRVIAEPKRGFYNLCRVAGVHPRSQLKFPATPVSIRLAVRRMLIELAIKKDEVESELTEIEDVLYNLTPMFVLRILKADHIMQNAFRVAFGIDIEDLLAEFPLSTPPTLRSVKTSLLLANQYTVMSLARFSKKYLSEIEFTPLSMRYNDLLLLLDEYSKSSIRRRRIASQD